MTAATIAPSILDAAGHGLTWTRYNERQPTSDRCSVAWCDGECENTTNQDAAGVEHFHDVAVASIDGETVLQVAVTQWRPRRPGMLADSGSSFRVLTAQAPAVDVYVYRDEIGECLLMFEEYGYVESFAAVLRTIGHDEFADIMTAAAEQLRAIKQEGGR